MKNRQHICVVNRRANSVSISTVIQFFKAKEDYIFSINDGLLEIRRPNIDYRGKTYSCCITNGSFRFTVSADIRPGKYFLDEEESNEDVLVFDISK